MLAILLASSISLAEFTLDVFFHQLTLVFYSSWKVKNEVTRYTQQIEQPEAYSIVPAVLMRWQEFKTSWPSSVLGGSNCDVKTLPHKQELSNTQSKVEAEKSAVAKTEDRRVKQVGRTYLTNQSLYNVVYSVFKYGAVLCNSTECVACSFCLLFLFVAGTSCAFFFSSQSLETWKCKT